MGRPLAIEDFTQFLTVIGQANPCVVAGTPCQVAIDKIGELRRPERCLHMPDLIIQMERSLERIGALHLQGGIARLKCLRSIMRSYREKLGWRRSARRTCYGEAQRQGVGWLVDE